MTIRSPRYGRKLADFEPGAVYAHPWEVTLDAGMTAFFSASFMDATPTYASTEFAKQLGFRERPISPLLLLNLGLSFSVHDVSEQAIAHLAYINVRFPNAAYVGDTVAAVSTVLGTKPSSAGDKGVVHVSTVLTNQRGEAVCAFERKALIPAGNVDERPKGLVTIPKVTTPDTSRPHPRELDGIAQEIVRRTAFPVSASGLAEGDVFAHRVGKTVGDSEHMQLTTLMRNTHPLHFDEVYCKAGNSFRGTRVVYGGLVLAWVHTLASRDLGGHAVWDSHFDEGAHPNGVVAGDTLYAASKILSRRTVSHNLTELTVRLVGVKNTPSEALIAAHPDFFEPELGKAEANRVKDKVVEITRRALVLSLA